MTSQPTREELVDQLYLAGLKDPRKVARIMALIEAYVYARVRSLTREEEPAPEVRLYKCTGKGMCHKEKPLEDFPERKRENPRLTSPCSWCATHTITMRDVRG